ncbi:hepatocyte growth factor-like protein [Haliotis rubra]|uniref:hepatocyte growth factor-like protein n=1 Tax=Haliotis rubra TaxID=36100 RepID=UPI001EE5E2BF|nr:hepatocyte growth factor-like protein [Haliotis rubra]
MARLLLVATLAALASLAACQTDCYTKQDFTAVYGGTVAVTDEGVQCQSWSSKTPNNHAFLPEHFDVTNGAKSSDYPGNYCRDPSGNGSPSLGFLWCYTATGTGWGTCDIHKCHDQ